MAKAKKKAAPKKVAKKPSKASKTEEVVEEVKPTKTEEVVEEVKPTKTEVQNESPYTIENDSPLPPRARVSGIVYPFRSLEVGQSFKVPAEIDRSIYKNEEEADRAQSEECRKLANRLSGAKRRVEKANSDLKFAIRKVSDGVRVWRIGKA